MEAVTIFLIIFGLVFLVFIGAIISSALEGRKFRGRMCPKCGTEMEYMGWKVGPNGHTNKHFICPHCGLSRYERLNEV